MSEDARGDVLGSSAHELQRLDVQSEHHRMATEDALVGRLALMYLPDPGAVVRWCAPSYRVGSCSSRTSECPPQGKE